MLDQEMITVPKQPLTSYKNQQWTPHFTALSSEPGIATVLLAELTPEKGSLYLEPSANPEFHPVYLSRLYSPPHLSTEREKGAVI